MRHIDALKQLLLLQKAFPTFLSFVNYFFERSYGFEPTWLQRDIARFMASEKYLLKAVMAQRGEAKSSLAMLYAVYRFIHQPTINIMVVSSGGTNSKNLGRGVGNIINNDPLLAP